MGLSPHLPSLHPLMLFCYMYCSSLVHLCLSICLLCVVSCCFVTFIVPLLFISVSLFACSALSHVILLLILFLPCSSLSPHLPSLHPLMLFWYFYCSSLVHLCLPICRLCV